MAISGNFSTGIVSDHYILRVEWVAVQSAIENTSIITAEIYLDNDWRLDISGRSGNSITIGDKTYSFESPAITTKGTHLLATVISDTIEHDTDGKKSIGMSCSFRFNATIDGTYYGTMTATASVTLDQIARSSSLTAENGTLGTAQTLTIEKADSAFKHKITYYCGGASGYIAGSDSTFTDGTSVSWTPPLSLASKNTTGTSVAVTLTLQTFTGNGERLGVTSKFVTYAIPEEVAPSCSLAVSDPLGYADKYGAFIKGLSKFEVVVTPTIAHDSPIASYNSKANGATYTAASFTTDVLKTSGTLSIEATVKDGRGRSGSASVQKSVLDYAAPVINSLTVNRCNADGTGNSSGKYLIVSFSAKVTSLDGKNAANYAIRYKKSADTEFTEDTLTGYSGEYSVSKGVYVFAADTASSYDVTLVVSDDFFSGDSAKTKSAVGASITKLWSILKKGTGLAIGKIAELAGVFDIAFKTRFYGGILPVIIPDGTDLDTLLTPNLYSGRNASTAGYLNAPTSTAPFILEVLSANENDHIVQRCSRVRSGDYMIWERHYCDGAWDSWGVVAKTSQILWSGAALMGENETISLSSGFVNLQSGVELVFSPYVDGAAQNTNFQHRFVSKASIAAIGTSCGHDFTFMNSTMGHAGGKYLTFGAYTISGTSWNTASGTGDSGVAYDNNYWCLRLVIGV